MSAGATTLLVSVLLVALPHSLLHADEKSDPPAFAVEGLVEVTEKRLVQVDVILSGPQTEVSGLTAEDFEIRIGGRPSRDFILDDFCPESGADTRPLVPATYLFYFDRSHVQPEEWISYVNLAKKLVDDLVVGKSKAAIVARGMGIANVTNFTSDRRRLQQTLDLVLREARFVAEGGSKFNPEHRFPATGQLKHLTAALGLMANADAPKLAFYFGASPREAKKAPGALIDVGPSNRPLTMGPSGVEEVKRRRIDTADFLVDGALNEVARAAWTHGIRIYLPRSDVPAGMANIATKTGGGVLPLGAAAAVESVRDRLACIYTLSFDASVFPMGKALSLNIRVDRPQAEVLHARRIVLQDESTRIASRILGAIAAPQETVSEFPVTVQVIPLGSKRRRLSARIQVVLSGDERRGGTWDVGFLLLSERRRPKIASGRVTLTDPNVPVVFERDMKIWPGMYKIVAVAYDPTLDTIGSAVLRDEWKDLESSSATVGPIAVIQPAIAAFVDEEAVRYSGSLARPRHEVLRTDLPSAFMTIVCRDRANRGTLQVSRHLHGQEPRHWPPQEIDLSGERCAVVQDLLPEHALGPGTYHYKVTVFSGEETVATGERVFAIREPDVVEEPARVPVSTVAELLE